MNTTDATHIPKDKTLTKTTINKYSTNTTTYVTSPSAQAIESDITLIELLSALNSLKGKTPDLNRISYPMIKNISYSLKIRITNLFNNIFNNFITQSYKTSPILKPSLNKTVINNYRPISP